MSQTPRWITEFVQIGMLSVAPGQNRIVFRCDARGGSVEVGKAYVDRRKACTEAKKAETRSNLTKIAYVFERYAGGFGAVWIDRDCLLWQGKVSAYDTVRFLQRWRRADKKRFRSKTDPLRQRRDAIQYANDCCFSNPPPAQRGNAEGQEFWASRWLEHFTSKRDAYGEPTP